MSITNHISIIGIGLIGGALARAIREHHIADTVFGFDTDQNTIDTALDLALIDHGSTNLQADFPNNTDIIILCTPIGSYSEIIRTIIDKIGPNTLVTDVGSVKRPIMDKINQLLGPKKQGNYIPGHPIAGSEKSGILASTATLFKNKQIILTPNKNVSPTALAKIQEIWQTAGGKIEQMDAKHHDETYAITSHIPHLISFCYAHTFAKCNKHSEQQISDDIKTEFKAFTRLADSNPTMWYDIFHINKQPILDNINKIYGPDALKPIQTPEDIATLCNWLGQARNKRRQYGNTQHPVEITPNNANVLLNILPKIVAAITINSIDNPDHIGAGLLGLTENILNLPNNFYDIIQQHQSELNDTIKHLQTEITTISKLIENNEKDQIKEYMQSL